MDNYFQKLKSKVVRYLTLHNKDLVINIKLWLHPSSVPIIKIEFLDTYTSSVQGFFDGYTNPVLCQIEFNNITLFSNKDNMISVISIFLFYCQTKQKTRMNMRLNFLCAECDKLLLQFTPQTIYADFESAIHTAVYAVWPEMRDKFKRMSI